MQVLEIYTRHPSWDRGSRRLSVPSTIGTSSRGRDASTSQRSTSHWRGLRTGMARARTHLQANQLFTPSELDFAALASSSEAITVLQTQGKRLGAQLPVA
eukprot:4103747-Prymnesium_polylepis.1